MMKGWQSRQRGQRTRYSLEGHIFAGLKFPSNQQSVIEQRRGRWQSTAGSWNVAEFTVDNVDIHIHHDETEFVTAAGADSPLPVGYSQRMVEALRFVLADLIWWDVLLEAEPEMRRVTLFSHPDPRPQATIPPPIRQDYTDSFEQMRELFSCYLRYALRATDPELLQEVSAEWGEILRGSQGTLQTQATIFCISVEPLLRLIFAERPVELHGDQEALAQVLSWTARLQEVLTGEGCPENLRKRFQGLFSRMTGLSDRERFAFLAAREAVDLRLVKRWQDLRPVSAHGNRAGQGNEEGLFMECMAVLALLYQMVAHLIDYRGYLTNLTEPGWPMRPYPLVPSPTVSTTIEPQETG
jgi:hypothetical protein